MQIQKLPLSVTYKSCSADAKYEKNVIKCNKRRMKDNFPTINIQLAIAMLSCYPS